MKRTTLLAAVAAVGLGLAGCGGKQKTTTIRRGVAIYRQDDTFISTVVHSLEQYAKEIGRLEARLLWASEQGMDFPPYVLAALRESIAQAWVRAVGARRDERKSPSWSTTNRSLGFRPRV